MLESWGQATFQSSKPREVGSRVLARWFGDPPTSLGFSRFAQKGHRQVSAEQSEPLKYRLLSIAELMADKSVGKADSEEAYRRGYAQGYYAALENVKTFKKKGYTRIPEITNFLYQHWLNITRWRARATKEYFPPHMPEPASWLELRRSILKRDGYRCVWCGSAEDLHVDHVEQVQHGGVASEGNLRTLCRPCNLSRDGG